MNDTNVRSTPLQG